MSEFDQLFAVLVGFTGVFMRLLRELVRGKVVAFSVGGGGSGMGVGG